MTEVTASQVKDLRERTGAGMMDCKKALTESNGDMEAAIDWLRKKGLSAAAKKSSRVAAQGLVGAALSSDGMSAALIEVNAETDFVSRNESFQDFVQKASNVALTCQGDLSAIASQALSSDDGATVGDSLTNLIAVIGENMTLRRSAYLSVSSGVVGVYLHNSIAPQVGAVGVLVALESASKDSEALNKAARSIAMHVAAAQPKSLSVEDMDPEILEREKTILRDQARESGKPEEFIDKMIEGRIRKFYEESVLLEQVYLIDDTKRKVSDVVKDLGTTLGEHVTLKGFVHYKLGDGIETKESDFAAEVAEMSRT